MPTLLTHQPTLLQNIVQSHPMLPHLNPILPTTLTVSSLQLTSVSPHGGHPSAVFIPGTATSMNPFSAEESSFNHPHHSMASWCSPIISLLSSNHCQPKLDSPGDLLDCVNADDVEFRKSDYKITNRLHQEKVSVTGTTDIFLTPAELTKRWQFNNKMEQKSCHFFAKTKACHRNLNLSPEGRRKKKSSAINRSKFITYTQRFA